MKEQAQKAWAMLNRAVNCRHYIGSNQHKLIEDFLANAEIPKVVTAKKSLPKKAEIKPGV